MSNVIQNPFHTVAQRKVIASAAALCHAALIKTRRAGVLDKDVMAALSKLLLKDYQDNPEQR